MAADWLRRVVGEEGSTRPAALIRIGLPLLLWTKWGQEHLLLTATEPDRLLIITAFWIGTAGMLFGIFSRLSAALTGLATLGGFIVYLGGIQGQGDYLHHHTYLLAIAPLLLAFTPCGGSYSWDRWRAVARAKRAGTPPPFERGALWGQHLIALQLSAIYFWGAINKCTAAFLGGDRMEQTYLFLYFGSDAPDGAWFHLLMVALAWGTVGLELALAFGLFIRRTHRWLLPAGMIFHALIYITLPVGPFTATVWLLYLAAVEPAAVHRFIDRLSDPRA